MDEHNHLNETEEFKQLNHLFARTFISIILTARKTRGDFAGILDIPIDPDSMNYAIQVQEYFNEDTNQQSVKIGIVKDDFVTH